MWRGFPPGCALRLRVSAVKIDYNRRDAETQSTNLIAMAYYFY